MFVNQCHYLHIQMFHVVATFITSGCFLLKYFFWHRQKPMENDMSVRLSVHCHVGCSKSYYFRSSTQGILKSKCVFTLKTNEISILSFFCSFENGSANPECWLGSILHEFYYYFHCGISIFWAGVLSSL